MKSAVRIASSMPVFRTFIFPYASRASSPVFSAYMMGRSDAGFNPPGVLDMPEEAEKQSEVQQRIRAAGERARAEADARRKAADAESAKSAPHPKEVGGRDGPDPVRHGDWEVKGVASDF